MKYNQYLWEIEETCSVLDEKIEQLSAVSLLFFSCRGDSYVLLVKEKSTKYFSMRKERQARQAAQQMVISL